MGDVIVLRSTPVDLGSSEAQSFIVDCCRAAEKLVSDDEVREKYGLSVEAWRGSVKNQELVKAVRAEKERRVLNGTAARESAARSFVKAPAILDEIMSNDLSNPKHKIDAIRELRATVVGNGDSDSPTNSEKFLIYINLGEDHVTRKEFDLAPNKSIQVEDKPDGEQ